MATQNLQQERSHYIQRSLFRPASIVFAAGTFGGLVNSVTVWLFGWIGITTLLGVKIAPAFSPAWLYPRLVWGGLWGLLFLLPLYRFIRPPLWLHGLLFSLAPSLTQLLLVFPLRDGKGLLGLALGGLTPVFVLLFNAIWGVATAFWLYLSDRKAKEGESPFS
jgi:hypothetical protein